MPADLYNLLADLLSYPADGPARCDVVAWEHRGSQVLEKLALFTERIRNLNLHERQELFIRTFDLNPVCSLEMGWHLFGENYDRGLLLVKMRQQMRAHGLPETTELPDHLTNGIRLLGVMDRRSAGYFAEAIFLPALEKMLAAIRDKQNPYEHVLEATLMAVRNDFPDLPSQLAVPESTPEFRVLA